MNRRMAGFAMSGVLAATVGLVGFAGRPQTASASGWGFSFAVRGGPVWVPPVYETRERVIIEPPVYEERPKRIWREPVYEERRVRVEIPAEIVTRREPVYNSSGRIVGYRLVDDIRRPARSVWKTERVEVRPGQYDTIIERVIVRPETRRVIHEQVMVRPGRWERPTYRFNAGHHERH